MDIVFSPTPVSIAVLKYSDLDKSFTTNTFHRVLRRPAPQNERVCLDDLPLAFEGEVTLSCPTLGHLGNEEGVGGAHSGRKYGLDVLNQRALQNVIDILEISQNKLSAAIKKSVLF